jgi:predicted methyltransferase
MNSGDSAFILSHFQVDDILRHQRSGTAVVAISLDLGLTTTEIRIASDHISLPDGQMLTWPQLDTILQDELACYRIANSQIEKLQYFSEEQNLLYSLMPTERAPTMLISGIPMHRIKGTDPYEDTRSKIKAISPVVGKVLDTTMGLGYTAIEAAKTAADVTTIELDPTVTTLCRHNPWSQALFDNPRITRVIGDAYDEIEGFASGTFTRIIHDPPMFSLAGHLYSAEFYRQLRRVLTAKGRLFHYIGDPKSKSGSAVTRGVVRRLKAVGFRRIVARPQAFGVVAFP